MGQALYRKYRSKSLREIVGQEHITDTLTKALDSGRISHAYLFSGPRGVGKTSIARILAHEVNGLPYTDDAAHLDIIEIDAASNRRIDEIRELRDKVYIAPTSGKYKVYIIDEVHMLTREAFNALLKTLEEPPAHAIFILATTESHKLPETIISRTQHFTFKPVEPEKVIDHLKQIAKSEGVKLDDDALALLAAHGGGSFRDSISVLDQARSLGDGTSKITGSEIRQLLGIAPDEAIDNLIQTLGSPGSTQQLMTQLNGLYGQGLQAARIASQLAARLRSGIAEGSSILPEFQALDLLKRLIEVPVSYNPARALEIALLESVISGTAPAATAPPASVISAAVPTAPPKQDKPAPLASVAEAPSPAKKEATEPTPPPAEPKKEEPVEQTTEAPKSAPVSKDALPLDAASWSQVLTGIKKEYNTIYGVLRMAHPIFIDGGVELQFKFAFHQKRINEVKNRQIIAGYIKQVTGSEAEVKCTYNKDAESGTGVTPAPDTAKPDATAVAAISDIFGGAEVLDS
jgi:DNA polymerase-3 subunit gamma/tau